MIKRALLILAVIVVALLLLEAVNLLRLRANISRYATYWQQQKAMTGQFTYVALGDSAAQGLGASQPQRGYVGLLAAQIAATTGETVRTVNLSVTGARINDVLAKQLPELKNYKPDLLTVEIGANDVNHWNERLFTAQYNELAKSLPAGTIIANVPYFGGRIRNNALALKANRIIAQAARQNHLRLVDLQTYTRDHQSLLNYASDLFHPSDKGYRNWDGAFWQVVRPLLHTVDKAK